MLEVIPTASPLDMRSPSYRFGSNIITAPPVGVRAYAAGQQADRVCIPRGEQQRLLASGNPKKSVFRPWRTCTCSYQFHSGMSPHNWASSLAGSNGERAVGHHPRVESDQGRVPRGLAREYGIAKDACSSIPTDTSSYGFDSFSEWGTHAHPLDHPTGEHDLFADLQGAMQARCFPQETISKSTARPWRMDSPSYLFDSVRFLRSCSARSIRPTDESNDVHHRRYAGNAARAGRVITARLPEPKTAFSPRVNSASSYDFCSRLEIAATPHDKFRRPGQPQLQTCLQGGVHPHSRQHGVAAKPAARHWRMDTSSYRFCSASYPATPAPSSSLDQGARLGSAEFSTSPMRAPGLPRVDKKKSNTCLPVQQGQNATLDSTRRASDQETTFQQTRAPIAPTCRNPRPTSRSCCARITYVSRILERMYASKLFANTRPASPLTGQASV